MKRTTTTLFWTFLALAMLACGGGNSNPGNDGVEPDVANDTGSEVDVIDNDCSNCAEADVAGDEQTETDNDTPDVQPDGMVCTDGVCCDSYQCCQNDRCWAIGEDTTETDDNPADGDSTTEQCWSDDYCEADFWCEPDAHKCLPDSVLEPYKFLEGNWKCLEGEGHVGEVAPLKLTGYDEATQAVKALGLMVCKKLTFNYAGDTLTMTATKGGATPCYKALFDSNSNQISFDSDSAGQYHWVFELQSE